MRRLTIAACALFALPFTAAAQYPTSPPPAAPVKPAVFPPFQEQTLDNGVRLIVVESHEEPVLSISLSLPAGSFYDPPGKSGLAEMVAGLLTKGAGTRTAEQIAATIEGVGGNLSAGAGPDFLTVRADVLSPDAALAFQLVGDVITSPTFPDQELELLRKQTLSGLQLELSSAAALASRFFASGLYGGHPYGVRPTPETVTAITKADLLAFQTARLRPQGALLVVAGDITMQQARQLAERSLGKWSGKPAPASSAKEIPQRTSTELLIVHRPGSVQSNIVVGNTTFLPTDPRWYASVMANRVLGGGADARLFLILREQKSWTYGAYSNLQRPKGIGAFQATTEVRTEVTDSALVELMKQLRRIDTEPVPATELENARNAVVGAFPLTIETANQVAGAVTQAKLLGLPDDYLQMYRTRLAGVTAQQLRAAAKTIIRPDAALIVVVGDATKIYDKIKDVAPTRIVDVEGNPLAPEDLEVKAAAIKLDMSKIAARNDSFAVVVQGNALGYQKMSIAPSSGGGFTYKDQTVIATFVNQKTESTLGPDGSLRKLTQSGKVQTLETHADVSVANGKATGTAVTANSPTTLDTVTVNVDVPAGTLDDNSIPALVAAFPFAADASWTFPVLSAGDGSVKNYTLHVTGEESVTVPAGTFDTFVTQLSGGQQPITFYVTRDAPHRVVKFTLAGQPLEIVLVK